MADKPQQPPPDKMIPELRTPNPADVFFRELVSRDSSRWQQNNPIKRGTKYSSLIGVDQRTADAFPDLYFLSETVPIGSNTIAGMTQSDWVIWNWMTDSPGESPTNAEISLLADAVTNPVYARFYTIRRSVYEASPTIATGTSLTALLGAKVLNGGINYTQARVALFGPGSDSGGKIVPVIASGVITHFVVEAEGDGFDATSTMQVIGDGQDAEGQLLLQPAAAILTSQKKIEFPEGDARSNEFVKVLRVYEVLPGPWIPFTRYDDDLGPIQGRRRAVLNTGQRGGVISRTGKRNYEGRDGSSVVSIEIEELFSDGTGSDPNNPTYPILRWAVYQDERGDVHRTSQIVQADPFHGETATLVRNFGRMIKTWYEPYQDNPFLLRKFIETWVEVTRDDKELTSQHGGAIADVTERRGQPGTLNPERGLMLIGSQTETISPDEQVLVTKKNPATEWPTLHGFHTDDVTGIVILIDKKVVDMNTPVPARSGHRGPFVELQHYDWDKGIQLTSRVDPNTLPGEERIPWPRAFTLPPTLLSVEAVWSDATAKLAKALGGNSPSAHAEVKSSSNGDFIVTSSRGFRGIARGYRVRNYYLGLVTDALIPTPFKIMPTSGSVVFTAIGSQTEFTNFDDGGSIIGDDVRLQVHAGDIRDHLVGIFQILNPTHQTPPRSASAVSGGGSVAAVATAGTLCTMEVRIPQSTPASLVSGQEILADVVIDEWRLDVTVVDRFYIIVP